MAGIHFTVTENGSPLNIHQLPDEGGEWCFSVNQGVATAAQYALAAMATVYCIGQAAPILIATALAGLFVPQLGQQVKDQFDKIFEMKPHDHNGEPCQQGKALQIAAMVVAGYLVPAIGAVCVGHWLSEQARDGVDSVSKVIDDQVEVFKQVDGTPENEVPD